MSDTTWHPSWCDRSRCYTNDDTGVRVHVQTPTQWSGVDTQFSIGLFRPEDEAVPMLELTITPARGTGAHLTLPLPAARKLAHQIGQRLNDAIPRSDDDKIGAALEALTHSGVLQHGRREEAIEAAVTAALDAAGALT